MNEGAPPPILLPMKTLPSALLAGLIFGCGLLLSGMGNPDKVLAFLDLAGAWDPSLALVMLGAIGVALPAFQWAAQRRQSLLGVPLPILEHRRIDRPLLLGSALFGIGWGLAGFCPGPGLLGIGSLYPPALIFSAGLLAGIFLNRKLP